MGLLPSIYFDLDNALPRDFFSAVPHVNVQEWGPHLRFCAPQKAVEKFYEKIKNQIAPFTLFGSGDFHHLTALWLRRVERPLTLISFDNHPDWDVRPPFWSCGGWVNRALELPCVQRASIWGCGNFELNWPHHLFADRQALRKGKLEVHPWRDRFQSSLKEKWNWMTPQNWREQFSQFTTTLKGGCVYVTVDLDCLSATEAETNWENGLFRAEDITWAIAELRRRTRIMGGDLCGAYSIPSYARWGQKLVAHFDRPHLESRNPQDSASWNRKALQTIWTALTGCNE